MVFGSVISSPRGNLSIQQALELATIYMEQAVRAQDVDIALVFCHDTEASLHQARRAAKQAHDQAMRHEIAIGYIRLGRMLAIRGYFSEAKAIYKKAEKLGVKVQEHGGDDGHSFDTKSIAPSERSERSMVDSIVDTPPETPQQPIPSQKKTRKTNTFAILPSHIFAENVRPLTVIAKLPEPDERLINTSQLAYCLALLKDSHELDEILEPSTRKWLHLVENDEDERERLKVLALDVIRTFKKEEIKDAKAIAEVVCLAPVIERDIFRDLLRSFYDGIDHSALLDIHQLQGLAHLIQGADTGYLEADDLVKVLGLLATRLRETHQQSPQHIYQLTLAASYVLDAMADTNVKGLDRETLHEPLSSYLDALKGNAEPYLMYQAAYACQALLCVPDNESLWQATIRRTGKVIQGVSGLVTAAKGLDLNGFMYGLKDIQQGLAGASEVVKVVVTALDVTNTLTSSGQGFMEGLKEGLSLNRKCAWYSALRGADTLIQEGEFAGFKRLVCEAPCRMDPAFQWGVCQRLGEVAGNPTWDARTRRSAAGFLGEMYRNEEWGQYESVKEWIIIILKRLSSSSGGGQQYVETILQEMETGCNDRDKALIQACKDRDLSSYPLKLALPQLASPSLLDRVQNKPDVEGTLRQLRKQRLRERGNTVYIQPQAKAGLKASDNDRFPLKEKVQTFLESNQKVFLLLGDSGAGKSTFNLQLECDLWQDYKKTSGRIPLHINLPAIDKPEQDMIAKQLRKAEFTESEIRELKMHRKFILICDGYDESQQTHNLYTSNRLNQPGEWSAQLLISCRSEYLGVDYRDRFQPGDRNSRPEPGQFQEAAITPFTPDQVQDYINQYVSVHQPLWEAKEYEQALDLIPSLKDLVKNPFLMTLSLEVLPRMMDPGEHVSATQVTRVALYDQFIEHWLERGKKRLSEKELSPQAKTAFESLVDEGFTQNGIDFLKKLAVAIYKEQGGQPIVKYSRFKDEGTWKATFFSREDEKQLLREACPLTRSGNQHRFIHRSLLEYGLALAIFDPHDWKEKTTSVHASGRRGSTCSAYSFNTDSGTEDADNLIEQAPDINSPLTWRNLVNEPSVLQFLCERVHHEPVFRKQLLNYIEYSKMDSVWRKAAANAITTLVRSGERFHGVDLKNIQIPRADLSYGMFDSANLQDADLRKVTLRGAWLRNANLRGAQMSGVQFGELPFIKEDIMVCSCAYSPDGNSIAVSHENAGINIYSTSSWERTRSLIGHEGIVRRIVYSPNGDRLVSGGDDRTARLWDIESGTCIRSLIGHEGVVRGVAYSPQGDAVASASDDTTIRVWDIETGECRLVLKGHTYYVMSIAYSPCGRQIVSGSGDGTARIWDIETETCVHTLRRYEGWIRGVAFSPQGDRVASCNDEGIRLWDVVTGTCCRILTTGGGCIISVAYSLQGDVIASADTDGTVQLWDAETGACRQVLTGHSGRVRCIDFSPKGDHIASASVDSTVRLWDVGYGGTRRVPVGHRGGVLSVKYSPRGDHIASSSRDGTIRLWGIETGVCHRVLAGHTRSIMSIAYSPRGDVIVSASEDETVRIWDVETGICRQTFAVHDEELGAIAYSSQRNQVASGDSDCKVKLWNMDSGASDHILAGHTDRVTSIAYSPNGNQIATSSDDYDVRIWDTNSGVCLHTLGGHSGGVVNIVYSPQGGFLASVSEDMTARLWNTETGDCHATLIGHCDEIHFIVYSPCGGQVASGCEDGIVKLWNVETGNCLHDLTGHTRAITGVVFSLNGSELVTGSDDKTIRLWDVLTGQCLAVIQDLSHSMTSIDWNPTSTANCFVIGCPDGSVRRWQVTGEEGQRHVRLCWGPTNDIFSVRDALIQDVHGLNQLNKQLLKQRGAAGEPFVRLHELSKKLVSMASVVSGIAQGPNGKIPDSTSYAGPSDEQPEEQGEESDT